MTLLTSIRLASASGAEAAGTAVGRLLALAIWAGMVVLGVILVRRSTIERRAGAGAGRGKLIGGIVLIVLGALLLLGSLVNLVSAGSGA